MKSKKHVKYNKDYWNNDKKIDKIPLKNTTTHSYNHSQLVKQ